MNGSRDQLLARSTLALNEDARTAGGGLNDQVEHLPHLRAPADDVAELVIALLNVLAEVAVLVHQPTPFHRVANHDEHCVVLERLRDVVEGTALHRGDGALDRRERGDDDDRKVFVETP